MQGKAVGRLLHRASSVLPSAAECNQISRHRGPEAVVRKSDHKGSEALDAALIAAAQKAEHYEIASYGCLCTWAELMGHDQALRLLKDNLAEEKEADEKLTEIARATANLEAQHG